MAAARTRRSPRTPAPPTRRRRDASSSCAASSRRRTEEPQGDPRAGTASSSPRLKAENADLRHKLGDARGRAHAPPRRGRRAPRPAADGAARRGVDGGGPARGRAAAAPRPGGGARARPRRRTPDRSAPSGATGALRARLLLDTLLDTAQGLRRELALPAVEGSPADAVEAHVAEHGQPQPARGTASLAVDDPALLEQLLALPRAHLVVDGYNVTKTAWPELSLERQRDRLLGGLAPLVARSGAEVTVVFDAADSTDRPVVNRPRGVRVLFSPAGVIADDVIRELVAAEPQGRPLVVVSSDNAGGPVTCVRAGARAVAAGALTRLLGGG